MSNAIGSRLRGLRERRGWTQAHLASVSGVSPRQVQRIEAGANFPRSETQMALAAALDVDVSELLVGFTAEQLEELREEYLCPHCGSKLATRTAVPHEYGADDLEQFECGFTRGMYRRPCPNEPRFPSFEDYDLVFLEGSDRWSCQAIARTSAASEVPLGSGRGDTREEAARVVQRSYILARDGYEAAKDFMPF